MFHGMIQTTERLILLLGPPRIGKTTIVQKVMCRSRLRFGGFFTLADNRVRGPRNFTLITIDGRQRGVPEFDRVLLGSCGVPDVSTFRFDDLETRGIAALEQATVDHDVVVIDELGSLQLHSAAFRDLCLSILASKAIVLLTAVDSGVSFIDELCRRPDCYTYHVSRQNRCSLPDVVATRLRMIVEAPSTDQCLL